VSYDNAVFQWRDGERRLRDAPADQRRALERVTERLVAELRRKLGGAFTTAELTELYEAGTDWCLEVAIDAAPEQPYAWDSATADAAFARYSRDAVDYAGGRVVS
jgi:hypothetical protein